MFSPGYHILGESGTQGRTVPENKGNQWRTICQRLEVKLLFQLKALFISIVSPQKIFVLANIGSDRTLLNPKCCLFFSICCCTWVAGNEVIVKNINVNSTCVFTVASAAFLGLLWLPCPCLSSIHCFKFVRGQPRFCRETELGYYELDAMN